jgi:nicotinamidase-related amidase
MMKNTILIIVDVQNAIVEGKPFDVESILSNIKLLLSVCREKGIPVLYIQHDGKVGSEFEPYTYGWEIHKSIGPINSEPIIHKRYNSAFKETDLHEFLQKLGMETIILVGMQTEYCIDTTCRVAFEKGYKLIMPEKSNTTFGNDNLSGEQIYMHHNFNIFKNRFAKVESMDSVIKMIVE